MSTVGKTKLLMKYRYGVYEQTGSMTIAVDSYFIKTQKTRYRYYDTAGQDRFRTIVDSYYRDSDACVIVYDTNSMKSFKEISFYYNRVKEIVPQSKIYLIGTKCDLQQKVPQNQAKKQYHSIQHFITSSKNGVNVIQKLKKIQNYLLDAIPTSFQIRKNKINPIKIMKDGNYKNEKGKSRRKCCKI